MKPQLNIQLNIKIIPMSRLMFTSLCLLTLISFSSCKKYAGQGGKSSISGKLLIDEKLYINGIYSQTASYTGATEDMYIIYGENKLTIDW